MKRRAERTYGGGREVLRAEEVVRLSGDESDPDSARRHDTVSTLLAVLVPLVVVDNLRKCIR